MDRKDRLTSKLINGYVFGPYFKIHDDAEIKPIVDKLGAYEDTGLTPEEITELRGTFNELADGLSPPYKTRDLIRENARLRAERDKAVEDLSTYKDCGFYIHRWQWRGPREAGKEENQ